MPIPEVQNAGDFFWDRMAIGHTLMYSNCLASYLLCCLFTYMYRARGGGGAGASAPPHFFGKFKELLRK